MEFDLKITTSKSIELNNSKAIFDMKGANKVLEEEEKKIFVEDFS